MRAGIFVIAFVSTFECLSPYTCSCVTENRKTNFYKNLVSKLEKWSEKLSVKFAVVNRFREHGYFSYFNRETLD